LTELDLTVNNRAACGEPAPDVDCLAERLRDKQRTMASSSPMDQKAGAICPSSRNRAAVALLGCVAFGTTWLTAVSRLPLNAYPPTSVAAPKESIPTYGNMSLAYRESFGFFRDISDEDWKRRQKRARNHRHQARPADKEETKRIAANRWYLRNYYPLFTCPDQQRVGIGGDGPKWACDPHRLALPRESSTGNSSGGASRDKCLVYSIGSNGNYVFEDGLVQLLGAGTCEIHVFDMSRDFTRRNDAANKAIYFHHWGLGSSYSDLGRAENYTYLTLQETMEKLGHVNRTIDIFKIDCEKCTYPSAISRT
jgi:Methyltransferase domain